MKEFKENIVLCDGIKIPETKPNVKYIHLEHRTGFENKNVNINLTDFVTHTLKLDNRYRDLLEIAGLIFAADRSTSRGNDDAVEYHSWSRSFHFHIKVRDFLFWNKQSTKNLLNEVLCYMTGDHKYEFTFYTGKADFPTSIFDNEKFAIENGKNLSVILFSGGIDSLSGIIETLETTKDEVCLVSHQSGQPKVIKTQNSLFAALKELYADRVHHYKFTCGLSHTKSKDESQRSRSFLYTSIAFSLAKTYSQDCIYVYENGITSINFAETQDLMNGRASRTTHPKTLRLLEKLFTEIGEEQFTIRNDFLLKTKTDVIDVLKKYKKMNLLDSSVSCSKTRDNTTNVTHCGICSQCIDRIFATYALGVENYDDNGIYNFNFLKMSIGDEIVKRTLIDYIRLAQNFVNETSTGFAIRFGSELVDVELYIDGETEEERVEKIYKLCQRHSKQIETAITRMRSIYDKPLAPKKPKSFFSIIVGTRAYQKSEEELKKEEELKQEEQRTSCDNDDESNRELENAHTVIKKQKRKIRFLEQGISKVTLLDLIDRKCRKKNGKINYSELGRQLGCTHHTAKDKCDYFGIN